MPNLTLALYVLIAACYLGLAISHVIEKREIPPRHRLETSPPAISEQEAGDIADAAPNEVGEGMHD